MTSVKHMNSINLNLITLRAALAFCFLFLMFNQAYANGSFVMNKKSIQDYANAMSDVQMHLEDMGFKVEFVQRIDVGLAKAGYHSDKYRIVFFMPKHGVADVLSKRADLASMFPLKVTVYRDKGKVYVFGVKSASLLDASVPADVRAHFQTWDKKVDSIVKDVF